MISLLAHVFLVPVVLLGQTASPKSISAITESLFKQISAPWGMPYNEWRKLHQSAKCKKFQGTMAILYPRKVYAYQCIEDTLDISSKVDFFVLPDVEPQQARLSQVEQTLKHANLADPVEVRLVQLLDLAIGKHNLPYKKGHVKEWTAWKIHPSTGSNILIEPPGNKNAELSNEIRVRVSRHFASQKKRLKVESYHQSLVQFEKESEAVESAGRAIKYGLRSSERIKLLESIQDILSQDLVKRIRNAKQPNQYVQKDVEDAKAVRDLLQMNNKKSFTDSQHATSLYLADMTIPFLISRMYGFPVELRGELESLGANYYFFKDEGDYTHSLLKIILDQYRNTPLAEKAWADYLNYGLGSFERERFRRVIESGEMLLKKYPKSQYKLNVMWCIGRAHETLWALSQVKEYFDGSSYLPEAPMARERAIEIYEWIVREHPDSLEARTAVLRLPRLRLDITTNCNSYSPWDCG